MANGKRGRRAAEEEKSFYNHPMEIDKDIHESGEDYLERILMLEETKGTGKVHAIDIANSLGYSKPSISKAIKKLSSLGYLEVNRREEIALTETGLEVASKTYERHRFLGNWLVSLGVSPEQAFKDACKIEHDLSEETYNALKEHFDK